MTAKRILITNDDGVGAQGLIALEKSLASLGKITVVAPEREMSATSQSISLQMPVRVKELDERHYAVTGTPADAVILALYQLLPQKPDLVVSGINHGGNLGENVIYSGTIAAAMQALLHGVPSYAISLATHKDWDFSIAASFAAHLAAKILKEGLPERVMLSVNVPPGEVRGVRLTHQSQEISQNRVREQMDPRGRAYFWLDESIELSNVETESDYAAILANEISITPLHADRTHYPSLNHLSRWLPDLPTTLSK